MKQLKVLSAVGLLALAGTANAGFSSTITATNDYDFRGFTQTDEDPALQASADFAMDSGWYIGAWASNVNFGDADIEVDAYTGFTGKIGEGTTWDAGLVYYSYPGASDSNTAEIYGSLAWSMFKGKVSYSDDVSSSGKSAVYVEGGLNVPLGEMFSLNAHVGYASGQYWSDEVLDYSAGAGMTLGNFAFVLKYVDTNTDGDDGRVILTVATTLPWK